VKRGIEPAGQGDQREQHRGRDAIGTIVRTTCQKRPM
jgi:hypothetical protein